MLHRRIYLTSVNCLCVNVFTIFSQLVESQMLVLKYVEVLLTHKSKNITMHDYFTVSV